MAKSSERNVYVFGATSFLNDTASEMAYWVLPAFLITLGASPMHLGVIEGIAESVAASAKLYSGYLTDKAAKRKPLVVAGYVVANAVKPLLALTTAWWQVLLIRFADRTAKGIRGAPRDVMLSESVPIERIGRSFGIMQSMDSAGAIVGPLLALWILHYQDVRAVFWWAAVPGFLSILVITLLARETRQDLQKNATETISPDPSQTGAAKPPIPRSFYYMLAAVAIFSVGNSSDMFLLLRAKEAGIPVAFAPLLGLVFNLVYTAASWPAGALADKFPKRYLAAAGYLVFAAVYAVFAAAPSRLWLWLMMAGYGLYYALTGPVLRALVVEEVPLGSRGRALGWFYFTSSITVLLASLITGFLWSRYGAPLPLGLSAALATVAALMLLFKTGAGDAKVKVA